MHQRRKEIPANLFKPDRENCLHAVAIALLAIRSDYGLTAKQLAKIADCGPDAIYDATNEKHLISLDSAALLCDAFPDETASIRALFAGGIAPAPTVADRVDRIERELAAIRRETEA